MSRLFAVLVASAMASCALFTSFDGLSGDPQPPVGDGGAVVEAGAAVDGGAVPADAGCVEPNAQVFQGHCYFVLPDEQTQAQAKFSCVKAGAHLVTVNSADEQALVASLTLRDQWIGLEASEPTIDRSRYMWITGEPMTVDFWHVTDPDDGALCVAMHQAFLRWVDRSCSQLNTAICERE